ncbi:MAG: shikimate kinase [Nitrospinae bacterium]|nr:shikimate kinase [Nitrospinota bacterium]
MNIVLIGYRGTGKTTVGKAIARRLKRRLIGMDDLIVKKGGMPIPEIVKRYGWERFRDMESEVTNEVSELDNCVIDCGGGVVLRDENITNLKRNGIIILLTADIERIIERIKDDSNRPPLKDGITFEEEQRQVIEERQESYLKAGDYIVDVSDGSVDEVVDKIVQFYLDI